MMKLFFRFLPILILTTLVILFFLPLFWPVPKLFVTPDSFLSDVLHFNYPLKEILSQSLKAKTIPLWTDLIGGGFPLIGEAEIGAFSIVNSILFGIFPTWMAFNLGYVITFIFLGVGMYMVGRELKFSPITALFVACTFTFSGFHIVQIPHYNHLQAFSYFPFLFFILLRTYHQPKTRIWLWGPLILSQMIFQGHYQYVFMSLITLLLFIICIRPLYPGQKKYLFTIGIRILIISIGLSAIQLIPSIEFFRASTRNFSVLSSNPTVSHGISITHLIQFVRPYIVGDIRNGTYPISSYATVFWEGFSYISIIPALLAFLALFLSRRFPHGKEFVIITIILLIFAFESNSPLYLMSSFPPFSWFRFHSRFLAFITFFCILLSGYTLDAIRKRLRGLCLVAVIIGVFLGTGIPLVSFAASYNPSLPVSQVMQKPELFQSLSQSQRIFPVGSEKIWFQSMYANGWIHPAEYLYFLNGATPNYPALHHIPTLSLYSGFMLNKHVWLLEAIQNETDINEKEKTASLSASVITALQLHNVSFITTPFSITDPSIQLIKETNPPNPALPPFKLYALKNTKPLYYLTDRVTNIKTVESFKENISKADALSKSDAFITSDETVQSSDESEPSSITIQNDTPTKKQYSVSAVSDTYFITSHYFYPGWEATLDGKKSRIIPGNLSGMAIFIPKGNHTLVLAFIPRSIYIGAGISSLCILLYIVYIIQSVCRISLKRPGTPFPFSPNARGSSRRPGKDGGKGIIRHTD